VAQASRISKKVSGSRYLCLSAIASWIYADRRQPVGLLGSDIAPHHHVRLVSGLAHDGQLRRPAVIGRGGKTSAQRVRPVTRGILLAQSGPLKSLLHDLADGARAQLAVDRLRGRDVAKDRPILDVCLF